MAVLANNNPRAFVNMPKWMNCKLGAVKIFEGAFLTQSSGALANLTAGDAFVGIARNGIDNTGSIHNVMPVAVEGMIERVKVTGASSASNIGTAVYLSDNNTLTLTASGNSAFGGKIVAFDSITSTFTVSFKSSII